MLVGVVIGGIHRGARLFPRDLLEFLQALPGIAQIFFDPRLQRGQLFARLPTTALSSCSVSAITTRMSSISLSRVTT